MRIAANKAKDHLKSAWARRTQLTDFAAESAAPAGTEALRRRQSCALPRALRRNRYAPCPSHTTPSCVLYFLQGCPVEDIARTLGRMPKTVLTSFTAPS